MGRAVLQYSHYICDTARARQLGAGARSRRAGRAVGEGTTRGRAGRASS